MEFIKYSLIIGVVTVASGERLHEQIYSSIEGGAACFRRLNGTHQAGCSSSDKGAVGVVQMINDVSDAEWFTHNGTAGPYMAVVSTSRFYDIVEVLMKNPEMVAGVLLYENATMKANAFSQESRCPNEYTAGPGSQCSSTQSGGIVWNDKGTGLLRRDIPFPIFYLADSRIEEIEKIDNCYKRFNVDRDNQKGMPLCSLQLNSFMFAAINSEVCMRRSASSSFLTSSKVCDPLGDQNVYYSLFPRGQGTNGASKPVTLVTARIDSATLFDGLSPGAATSVVGLVSTITAASLLSKMIPDADASLYSQNILWTLFNGEAFDYIGSQRVAYDIARGAWPSGAPLRSEQILLHVELGQVGGALLDDGPAWPLRAFAPYASVPDAISSFVDMLQASSLKENNSTVTLKPGENVPPSSLHSFRRILANVTLNGDLPEVVLVDHDETFSNLFYQSALDDYEKIGFVYHNISIDSSGTFLATDALIANGTMKETDAQVKIARFATALAYALYQRLNNGTAYEGSAKASAHLVDEMLYCFLQSQACRLLSAADYAQGSAGDVAEQPAALYVGVAAWPGSAAVFAGHLLALLAGRHLPDNSTACEARQSGEYSYYWLRGWNLTGVCVQTTMNFSQAISPAFTIPDYKFSSGLYSTWTESVWQAMSARVFVTGGGGGARAAAITGAVTTALVALLTYWLKKHAAAVFVDSPAGSLASSEATTGILRTVNC